MKAIALLALCGLAACDTADSPVVVEPGAAAAAEATRQAVGDTDAARRDAASPGTTGTN